MAMRRVRAHPGTKTRVTRSRMPTSNGLHAQATSGAGLRNFATAAPMFHTGSYPKIVKTSVLKCIK